MLKYNGSLPVHIEDILKFSGDWCRNESADHRSVVETQCLVFPSLESYLSHTSDRESQEIEIPRFLVIDLHSRSSVLADYVCGSSAKIDVL
jgi:hypothetical protein